jgi:hypothetical protein
MSDPFADIRPYRDDEVRPVLERLLGEPELLSVLASRRFGAAAGGIGLLRPLVRWYLRRQLKDVQSVYDLQMVMKGYLEDMIDSTTAGFTVSGLDALDPDEAYLFISNHRDIAMDPAFTNYALHRGGHGTVRIAIGDNLLTKPWVSDLMRLNKSFIVNRSATKPREIMAASRHLSEFIRDSIERERASIWLAQREGRAKDGVDRTEPAVVKMLSLSRDKSSESFGEHIASLRVVPLAISYELDPCDDRKAREQHQRATTGSYTKAEQEDIDSIARGIAGHKGRVHAAFGSPLGGEFETAQAVAAEIDRQVVSNFRLHPSNLIAWRALHGDDSRLSALATEPGSISDDSFMERIESLPEPERPFALGQYAAAVDSKLAFAGGA